MKPQAWNKGERITRIVCCVWYKNMMISWHGKAFHVTGPLWGESSPLIAIISWFSNTLYYGMGIDGLVQGRHNSIANALELHLSCTNPSKCHHFDEISVTGSGCKESCHNDKLFFKTSGTASDENFITMTPFSFPFQRIACSLAT